MTPPNDINTLEWHIEMGVDETIQEQPINQLKPKPPTKSIAPTTASPPPETATKAKPLSKPPTVISNPNDIATYTKKLSQQSHDLETLEKNVRDFKQLSICKTATNTVFCDGNKNAKIMLIGEAPGADEDQHGIPFCGASGKLLDKMLSFISLKRSENFYITNTLFWRPPGNRRPTPEEIAICRPLVEKHIALLNPQLIILIGATAMTSILQKTVPITKARRQYFDYQNSDLEHTIPTTAIFHPSYLLRSPGQKRLAWQDLLLIQQYIEQQNIPI